MSARGPSAGRALLTLTGLLVAATVAVPEPGRAEPVWVRARQFPSAEPPLADGPARLPAGVPAVADVTHPPTPVVSIHVSYPQVVNPGRELEYRIVVENSAAADANHVKVRVPVPKNSTYKTAQPQPASKGQGGELVWDLETVKGRTRREITLVVEPTAGEDVECCARVSFEHGECVRTRVARPALRLRTIGPERAKVYEMVTMSLEVTNAGSADARDVVLTEELPPGLDFADSKPPLPGDNPLTWKLGTLAPGSTRRVEFKAIPMQMGSLLLKATATAAGGVKATEANLSRLLVGEARLSLIMTGPTNCSQDLPATYFLTVSNSGTTPATNIELRDRLFLRPAVRQRLEFVGASHDGRLAGDDVRWLLGTLQPGARRTVSMRVRHVTVDNKGGVFDNVAQVAADGNLLEKAYATTNFEPVRPFMLDIEKQLDPIAVGKTGSFTFRIRERDTVRLTRVALTVTLPDELQYVEARGKTARTPPEAGQTITFTPFDELGPGAETSFDVTVRALRPAVVKVKAVVTAEAGSAQRKAEQDESLMILPELATPPPAAAPAQPAPAPATPK